MKYRPVPILNVVGETEFPHGETTDNPNPAPRESSTSVIAAAAVPPANTAAHETPDVDGSTMSACALAVSV
jgi:hypothetical protein